jgi:hypothetical protein
LRGKAPESTPTEPQLLRWRQIERLHEAEFAVTSTRIRTRHPQSAVLLTDAVQVEEPLSLQYGLLRSLEDSIEAPKHNKRKDYVAIFTPHVYIAKPVVSYVPNEVGDPLQPTLILHLSGCHFCSF